MKTKNKARLAFDRNTLNRAVFFGTLAFVLPSIAYAQAVDSAFLKVYGLKGTVHVIGEDKNFPKTIIDEILISKIGLTCNQYLVKYFCEYQKLKHYRQRIDAKIYDYSFYAKHFNMPDIFINHLSINDMNVDDILKFKKVLNFRSGFTDGLSKNKAFFFELE